MPRYPHILFDLDGTLIDSAPAILASYREAFARCDVAPARTIDESIVGPPLIETLQLITGSHDKALIERLADGFKASYDSEGYKQTAAYAGVGTMLEALKSAGLQLSIATNKRILPTRLILAHLGWLGYFEHIYALDLFEPRLPDKAAMIARLLADHELPEGRSIYIGDRSEDGESADANQLPFIAATWGYGSIEAAAMAGHWRAAASPAELGALLLAD
jgi:phosphoglycolate phosphatase